MGDVKDFTDFHDSRVWGGDDESAWSIIREDPWRALIGFDPLSTWLTNKIFGKDFKPLTNWYGGPTKGQTAAAEAKGIDPTAHENAVRAGAVIAASVAGGALLGGAGGAGGAAGPGGVTGAASGGTGAGAGAAAGGVAGSSAGGLLGPAAVTGAASGATGIGAGSGAGSAAGSSAGGSSGGGGFFKDFFSDPSNIQQMGDLLGGGQQPQIDNSAHQQAVMNEQRKRSMGRRGLL